MTHSKYKNSGILFELLIKQITEEVVSESNSVAINILKKYFTNNEISKENKLYQILTQPISLTERVANLTISTAIELSNKLDKKKLLKEKYNLIKEIKSNYDINNFFKTPIKNYKTLASIYTLIESNGEDVNSIVSSKENILKFLTEDKNEVKDEIYNELSLLEKGERNLVYKIMLENFNKKYENISIEQKQVLKYYINNISNPILLKEHINNKLNLLLRNFKKNIDKIDNEVIKIKINEAISFINPILESKKMKDDYVVSLLQYQELYKEIKNI